MSWNVVVLRMGRNEDRRMGPLVLDREGAGCRTRLQAVREVALWAFALWTHDEEAAARRGCGCRGPMPDGASFCPWCGSPVGPSEFEPERFQEWLVALRDVPSARMAMFEEASRWTPWSLGSRGRVVDVQEAEVTLLLVLSSEEGLPDRVAKPLRKWVTECVGSGTVEAKVRDALEEQLL